MRNFLVTYAKIAGKSASISPISSVVECATTLFSRSKKPKAVEMPKVDMTGVPSLSEASTSNLSPMS